MIKVKAIPLEAWTDPEGSRRLRFQIPRQSAHESAKVVSPTHRPHLTPRKYSWYSFLLEAESTLQGHSAARRIMSMRNSNDTIGNRTRDLPTYSAMSQPTAFAMWGLIKYYSRHLISPFLRSGEICRETQKLTTEGTQFSGEFRLSYGHVAKLGVFNTSVVMGVKFQSLPMFTQRNRIFV